MNKLNEFSKTSLEELKQDKIVKFINFPPKNKTDFILPLDLPNNGIKWGEFHITGAERLIGFVVSELIEGADYSNLKNTFFVVFLDKNHRFYYSKKKHT